MGTMMPAFMESGFPPWEEQQPAFQRLWEGLGWIRRVLSPMQKTPGLSWEQFLRDTAQQRDGGDRWWQAPGGGLSQGWGRARTAPVPTHLPASIPVGQEPEHYAEDHVAKKHHLRGSGRQLWGARSQQHQAALLSKMEVS